MSTETLLDAIRRTAEAVANHQAATVRAPMDRTYKAGIHDIVTIHDEECEDIAREILRSEFPDCRIVGEEGGADGQADPTFYIDPIDGTTNYASGIPFFCVSIGATVDGELAAGVVRAPLLGLEFFADDTGAWVRDLHQEGQPTERLDGGTPRSQGDSVILTGYPSFRDSSMMDEVQDQRLAELAQEVSAMRNFGSGALELAFVAAGWADATFNVSTNSWDIAAGVQLVRMAGGEVRHYDYGLDVPELEASGYVAIAAGRDLPVLGAMMEAVSDYRTQQDD